MSSHVIAYPFSPAKYPGITRLGSIIHQVAVSAFLLLMEDPRYPEKAFDFSDSSDFDDIPPPIHEASAFAAKLHIPNVPQELRAFQWADVKPDLITPDQDSKVDRPLRLALRTRYITASMAAEVVKCTALHVRMLRVDKLFALVAPDTRYVPPPYANWALAAFVTKKSEPRTAKNGTRFVALSIGDFTRQVDILLFGDACDFHIKTKSGDLLYILNPTVNAKPHKRGFNLIANDPGQILEIGAVRDYATCPEINKKTGAPCGAVLNGARSSLCDYHVETNHRARSAPRMELSGGVRARPDNKSAYMGRKTAFVHQTYNEDSRIYAPLCARAPTDSDTPAPDVTARRRARAQRASHALEERLLNLAPKAAVSRLGLVPERPRDEAAPKERSAAFTPATIAAIGFDPTGGHTDNEHSRKRVASERVLDLRALSAASAKQKVLKSLSKVMSDKAKKWHEALRVQRAYDLRGKKKGTVNQGNVDVPSEDSWCSSSSDDDIAISFESEQSLQQYNRLVAGKSSARSIGAKDAPTDVSK